MQHGSGGAGGGGGADGGFIVPAVRITMEPTTRLGNHSDMSLVDVDTFLA